MFYSKVANTTGFITEGSAGFDGDGLFGYVTREAQRGDAFGNAVYNLAIQRYNQQQGPNAFWGPIPDKLFMTTEECWSGYSEYTVTSTWSAIVISVPEWDFEFSFPKVSEFLQALIENDDYV